MAENEEKSMASQDTQPQFIITRDFDAPRDLVWKMWTEPEMMKQWYGPANFTAPVMESDFRVGGRFLFDMRDPEGKDYWGTGEYLEIVAPERIVSTDAFADEQGNVVAPSYYGMPGDEPWERVLTTTFEELEDSRTRLTIISPSGGDEDEVNGWNEMLDKFAESLKMARAA